MSIGRKFLVVFLLMSWLEMGLASYANARDLRVVFKPGDLIPLPESSTTIPATLVPITSFRSGSLSHIITARNGDLVAEGIVDGRPLGLSQSLRAQWVRRINGTLEPLSRINMPAPDGQGTLSAIDIDFVRFTPSGRIIFEATRNNHESWWCKSGNQVRLIAEVGMTIDDPLLGTVTASTLSQASSGFREPFDTAAGCGLLFSSTIIETGSGLSRPGAIIRATTEANASTATILVHGAAADILPPDAPGFDETIKLSGLSFAQANSSGDLLAGVTLQGPTVSPATDRVLLFFPHTATSSQGGETVAREGYPARDVSYGGIVDLQWDNSFYSPQLNAAGKVVYRASFRNLDNTTSFAFWSNRAGHGEVIFAEDSFVAVPGSGVPATLQSATQYYLLDDNTVALWATVSGTSGLIGSFLADRGLGLELLAGEGMNVPGEAENYRFGTGVFHTNSFGQIGGASLAKNIVAGRAEFAITTTAGVAAPDPNPITQRIVFRTLGDTAGIAFRYGVPFSPEGDVAIIPSTGFTPIQIDERGNLAFTATVTRASGPTSYIQSLVTVNHQGQGELAFATGSVATPGDTVCYAANSLPPCPGIIGAYTPQPLADRERFVSSIDTNNDLSVDAGRLYVNLLTNDAPSSPVARIYSAHLGCRADINESGSLTVQDVFDFLGRYFIGLGDINGQSDTSVQDIFTFLSAYFGGC